MARYWPSSFVAFSWTETKFYALPAPDTSLKEYSLKSYFYRSLQLLSFLLMYGSLVFYWNRWAKELSPEEHLQRWENSDREFLSSRGLWCAFLWWIFNLVNYFSFFCSLLSKNIPTRGKLHFNFKAPFIGMDRVPVIQNRGPRKEKQIKIEALRVRRY